MQGSRHVTYGKLFISTKMDFFAVLSSLHLNHLKKNGFFVIKSRLGVVSAIFAEKAFKVPHSKIRISRVYSTFAVNSTIDTMIFPFFIFFFMHWCFHCLWRIEMSLVIARKQWFQSISIFLQKNQFGIAKIAPAQNRIFEI